MNVHVHASGYDHIPTRILRKKLCIPVLRAGVPCSKMDGVFTGSSTLDVEVDGLGDTH